MKKNRKEGTKGNMPTGVFRLKGSYLMMLGKGRGVDNPHQASMNSGVSYPTIHRYAETPEDVEAVHLEKLYGFIVDGLRITPEEIADMRFGDIFEAVPNGAK